MISSASRRPSRAVRDLASHLVWFVLTLVDGHIALGQTDSRPPGVSSISPSAGAVAVSRLIDVTATFSEPVEPTSISFALRDSTGAAVPAVLRYDPSTWTATLDPEADLGQARTYTATVSGAVDLAGNVMSAPVAWSFTTDSGFRESAVLGGLVQPTAFQFAQDGRVFVAEKSGLVKVFDSLLNATPAIFADLRTNVYNYGSSGLLGLALDPGFPSIPYVYVLYTYDGSAGGTAPRWGTPGVSDDSCPAENSSGCTVSARLSRLEAHGNVMTGPEHVLVADWYQRYPGQPVGGLAFGPDGALYASAGDGAGSTFLDWGQTDDPSPDPPNEGGALRSQDLRTPADPVTLSGSIIRIHPGGKVRRCVNEEKAV